MSYYEDQQKQAPVTGDYSLRARQLVLLCFCH